MKKKTCFFIILIVAVMASEVDTRANSTDHNVFLTSQEITKDQQHGTILQTELSQEMFSEAMDILSHDSKIKHSKGLLKDFVAGKSTTRVIVNIDESNVIKKFHGSQFRKKIFTDRDIYLRNKLKSAIDNTRNKVINRIDSGRMRVTNKFLFISSFSAEVSLVGLMELSESPEVGSIDKDQLLHAHTAQGIPLINSDTVRNHHSGNGLSIAICDTGIDYTHPFLGNGGFPNEKVIGGRDTGQNDNDPMDQNGHGTSCAGIAAGTVPQPIMNDYIGGVAFDAKLYALKITDTASGGSAFLSDIVEAWEWCIVHQNDNPDYPIMIISTSFGGGKYSATCDGNYYSMTQAAANALAAGITIFASSGNDGYCDALSIPACLTDVFSVGAVFDADIGGWGFCVDPDSCAPDQGIHANCDPDPIAWAYSTQADQVPPYSNTAYFLDFFAPSHFTYTLEPGGGYSSNFGGTSAACPYAAGAAAVLQSVVNTKAGVFLTPTELESRFVDYGDSVTDEKIGITKPRMNLGAAAGCVSDFDNDGDVDGNDLAEFSIRFYTNELDENDLTLFTEEFGKTDCWP